jgi:hypothetical protein
MLELDDSQELTPQLLRNELETARRILGCVTTQEDQRRVQAYIDELQHALDGQIAAST